MRLAVEISFREFLTAVSDFRQKRRKTWRFDGMLTLGKIRELQKILI